MSIMTQETFTGYSSEADAQFYSHNSLFFIICHQLHSTHADCSKAQQMSKQNKIITCKPLHASCSSPALV